MTITDALIAEHRVFTDIFDQIEGTLPDLRTLAEIRLLTSLIEKTLQSHADAEKDLAFVALDHALKDKGHLDRLHQDHQEIDASMRRIHATRDFEEARRLLKTAIAATRAHFLREEQTVFPLINQVLDGSTLAALGTARIEQRAALAQHPG